MKSLTKLNFLELNGVLGLAAVSAGIIVMGIYYITKGITNKLEEPTAQEFTQYVPQCRQFLREHGRATGTETLRETVCNDSSMYSSSGFNSDRALQRYNTIVEELK